VGEKHASSQRPECSQIRPETSTAPAWLPAVLEHLATIGYPPAPMSVPVVDRSCSPRAVSLPVLPPAGTPPNRPRKSRMSRRRAFVLIAVHVVIAAHIIQWLVMGVTLSPVEPSESMYTLELGQLNAGFVLFALALLSTIIFGRYFCGWACHVVALQDLCGHWMNKLGVKPRPFRSRLPLYWALLLALYMFVWPTFKREALFPLLSLANIHPPAWLAPVAPFPKEGLQPHFIVEDFWKTFAPPAVAIPFLIVCGFATVYFLGNKAFCTYGCPYGGFFAPLDKISIGRIVVSDACNHCGHCTAVCSSNVRVHQEVRDFGKVMDPGCMKCMDCVSVCPNDALAFKFAAPAAFTKPRTDAARQGRTARPPSDLTRVEEVWVFLLGIALFLALRQFLETVPLLMAAGLAMIGAFATWKLTRLARETSTTFQNLRLRYKGRITPAGTIFAAGTVLFLAVAGWSGWVRLTRYRADLIDHAVLAGVENAAALVYSPGYRPDPAQAGLAQRARRLYETTLPPTEGGHGWRPRPETYVRLSWLSAVMGDLDAGERYLLRAMDLAEPGEDLVRGLEQIRALKGATLAEAIRTHEEILARYPGIHGSRLRLAFLQVQAGHFEAAEANARTVLTSKHRRPSPFHVAAAAEMLLGLGRTDEAMDALVQERARSPNLPIVRAILGKALYQAGHVDEAVAEIRAASSMEPSNQHFLLMLAQIFDEQGRAEELAEVEQKLRAIQEPQSSKNP
jgi:polyferredoxin/tetratricopeptide (TPR) repeat protein